MPSTTSVCRRAAHCLINKPVNHVWISDEALANAFNRFVQVSHVSCKRYGSNVPGPLEARKRGVKRRMMGLATAGGDGGMGLGALLGFGQATAPKLEWQAPEPIVKPLESEGMLKTLPFSSCYKLCN